MNLNDMQHDVQDFHYTFDHPVSLFPTLLDAERLKKRFNWVREELIEGEEATDIAGQADAVIDAIYFLVGTLVEMGVTGEPLWRIVHAANMEKVWPDGTVHKNELGKVQKPPTWTAPEPKIEREIVMQQLFNADGI